MPRPWNHEAHGQRVHLPPRAAAVLGSPRTSPVSTAALQPGTTTPRAGWELGGGGRGGGGSLGSTLDEVSHGQHLPLEQGKLRRSAAGVLWYRGAGARFAGQGWGSWQEIYIVTGGCHPVTIAGEGLASTLEMGGPGANRIDRTGLSRAGRYGADAQGKWWESRFLS